MDILWQLRHVGLKLTCKDVPRIMRLEQSRITIGRAAQNDFILDSTTFEGFVSRQHAVVIRQDSPSGSTYTLHDKSTNGTIVNGYRIHGSHVLQENDTIAFGHVNGLNVPKGEYAYQPLHEFVYKFERCSALAPDSGTADTSDGESELPAASVCQSKGGGDDSSSEETSSYQYPSVPLSHQVSNIDRKEKALRKGDTELDITSIDLTQCTDDDTHEADSEDNVEDKCRADSLILKRNALSRKSWSCLPLSCSRDKEDLWPSISSVDRRQSDSVEISASDGLHKCSMKDNHEGSAPDGHQEDLISSDLDAGHREGNNASKAAKRISGPQTIVGLGLKRGGMFVAEEESLPDISSSPSSVDSGESTRGSRQQGSAATNFSGSRDSTLNYCDIQTTRASDNENLRKADIRKNSLKLIENAGYEGSSEEDFEEDMAKNSKHTSSSALSGQKFGSRGKGKGQVTKFQSKRRSRGQSSFPSGADLQRASGMKRKVIKPSKDRDPQEKLRRTAEWVKVANKKHVRPSRPSKTRQQDKNLSVVETRRALLGLRPLRRTAYQSGDAPSSPRETKSRRKTEILKQSKHLGGTKKNHPRKWKNDRGKEAASLGTEPSFLAPLEPAPEAAQAEDEVLESGVEWCEDELCELPNCQRPMGKRLHWVQCDTCSRWCHTVCVGCDYEEVKDSEKFYCGC